MIPYNILHTDAYKFSMAEAGAVLRKETFYYSHRRGGANGWHYMPIDIKSFIKNLLSKEDNSSAYEYLKMHSYEVGAGYRKAIDSYDQVEIDAIPKGAWFYNREPAFSTTGTSAFVSWLEPLSLQIQFRIQIATAYMSNTAGWADKILYATCDREKEIIEETLDSLMSTFTSTRSSRFKIEVRSEQYYNDILKRAKKLVQLVGNPDRIFEVGMRGVSCIEQHEIALRAIKEAGVIRTSNVAGAKKLGMTPVGTMGHEHIQRHGSDYAAFTSMRDRFPGFVFYLPDTFDTIRSGIPAALKVIQETPERNSGIRFDSENGIRGHYLYTAVRAREIGIEPILALESGWNYKLTEEFEELRKQIGWKEERQAYGYGGYFVKPEWPTFCRDDVSAVWKISQTGSRATMKFGDEPNSGKESIPGRPEIWRITPSVSSQVVGYIYQNGEIPDDNFNLFKLTNREDSFALHPAHLGKIEYSPETKRLVSECRAERAKIIQGV